MAEEHEEGHKADEHRKSVRIRVAATDEEDQDDKEDLKATDQSQSDLNVLKNLLIAEKNANKSMIFEIKEYKDNVDIVSTDPSYTDFDIPYVVKCKMRYAQKCRDYDKQFKKEMQSLEIFQQNAYEAARFSRHLGMTTLWPPLHNRREVDKFIQHYFVHTPKDRQRLRYLLSQPQT